MAAGERIGPAAWETSTVFAAVAIALCAVGFALITVWSYPDEAHDYCEAWADGYSNAWVGLSTEDDYRGLLEACEKEDLSGRTRQYIPNEPRP